MIASSPSGATVRSQSAEITPAPALPPFFSSLELVCVRVGLAWRGNQSHRCPVEGKGGHLILAQSSLNKWEILIKLSPVQPLLQAAFFLIEG